MLATSSLDGTVKLWHYRLTPSNSAGSSVSSAAGFLPGGAVVEFEDHELPVVKVALTSWQSRSGESRQRLVAGAAEDGCLVVWDADSQRSLFSFQCSPSRRPVTALIWIRDRALALASSTPSAPPRLLVATQDAKLLCTDISGTLVAALQCDSVVLCLGSVQGDGALVLGGCADGSVRLWSLTAAGGKLREVQRWSKAHSGPVTALALAGVPQSDLPCEMMVTGSEDCSVKVWRLAFDR